MLAPSAQVSFEMSRPPAELDRALAAATATAAAATPTSSIQRAPLPIRIRATSASEPKLLLEECLYHLLDQVFKPLRPDHQLLPPAALTELGAFLAIPSVSADDARVDAVREAVQWVFDFVVRAGGSGIVVDGHDTPLVDAIIPASAQRTAPTIL